MVHIAAEFQPSRRRIDPCENPFHLTGRLVLVLAAALALMALVACDSDNDSDMVEQPPAAETETARRAEPTAVPQPTPTPTAMAEPTAPPGLAAACLPGGGIEDVRHDLLLRRAGPPTGAWLLV